MIENKNSVFFTPEKVGCLFCKQELLPQDYLEGVIFCGEAKDGEKGLLHLNCFMDNWKVEREKKRNEQGQG